MFNYWSKAEDNESVSRFLNDHIKGVVQCHPDNFLALGTVPLQNVELAVKELIRCRYELNLNGIIIGTHVENKSLDDSSFEPFWKAAEEHSMPLFIHPWNVSNSNGRWSKYWLPYIVGMTAETTAAALSLAFSGVLERHRRLRICLSHGGGSLPYLSERANHGFHVYPNDMQKHITLPPNTYLKRSPNVCSDTLLNDPKALQLALDYFGEVCELSYSNFKDIKSLILGFVNVGLGFSVPLRRALSREIDRKLSILQLNQNQTIIFKCLTFF